MRQRRFQLACHFSTVPLQRTVPLQPNTDGLKQNRCREAEPSCATLLKRNRALPPGLSSWLAKNMDQIKESRVSHGPWFCFGAPFYFSTATNVVAMCLLKISDSGFMTSMPSQRLPLPSSRSSAWWTNALLRAWLSRRTSSRCLPKPGRRRVRVTVDCKTKFMTRVSGMPVGGIASAAGSLGYSPTCCSSSWSSISTPHLGNGLFTEPWRGDNRPASSRCGEASQWQQLREELHQHPCVVSSNKTWHAGSAAAAQGVGPFSCGAAAAVMCLCSHVSCPSGGRWFGH